MISFVDGRVSVTCDGMRCVRASAPGDATLTRFDQIRLLELAGWFFEQFPKRMIRTFCPEQHADPYRSMFARATAEKP